MDRLRARHRLSKFLLRQGLIWRETKAWGVKHRAWVRQQRFDFPALQGTFESYLRAVEEAEARLADLDRQVQDFRRFTGARQFMGYTGLVSREYSSGQSVHRGRITKVGNAHVRRVLVEAAWNYSRGAATGASLAKRRDNCSPATVAIARRAQERLSRKFRKMVGRGKSRQNAVVGVARELAGFVWAITQEA